MKLTEKQYNSGVDNLSKEVNIFVDKRQKSKGSWFESLLLARAIIHI
ncbi:hypothetical protein [Microseira wollei]|uniref:Transposase n=1 Tax=Microseira wollei NIES-4236 TaxID=2530354 RepID=A0AAV3XRF7_9CYAN|nr:hypothetical protein [Microseira wollei]GET44645.1 hypothetical protein MiSe_94760 [Microseira wollei NIES-4236]